MRLVFSKQNLLSTYLPQLTAGTLNGDSDFGDLANLYNGNPAHPLKLIGTSAHITIDCGSPTALGVVSLIHPNFASGVNSIYWTGSNTSRAATIQGSSDWKRKLRIQYRKTGGYTIHPYILFSQADQLTPQLGAANPSYRYWGLDISGETSPLIIGELFVSPYAQELTRNWSINGVISDSRPTRILSPNLGASHRYRTGRYERGLKAMMMDDAMETWWDATEGNAYSHLLIADPDEQADNAGMYLAKGGALFGNWALGDEGLQREHTESDQLSVYQFNWMSINLGLPWSEIQ